MPKTSRDFRTRGVICLFPTSSSKFIRDGRAPQSVGGAVERPVQPGLHVRRSSTPHQFSRVADVLQRIGTEDDQVGDLARFQCAVLIFQSKKPGTVYGSGLNRLHGCEAGFDHQFHLTVLPEALKSPRLPNRFQWQWVFRRPQSWPDSWPRLRRLLECFPGLDGWPDSPGIPGHLPFPKPGPETNGQSRIIQKIGAIGVSEAGTVSYQRCHLVTPFSLASCRNSSSTSWSRTL